MEQGIRVGDRIEKWQALVEFVFPIISLSLSEPYSIKQAVVKSIYLISYQTNKFVDSNRNPRHKSRPVLKDAEKVATHFASWPKLLSSLSLLNASNFTNATGDFRNQFNHGFPRRIEIGETLSVQQNRHSLRFTGDVPPLQTADLIPLLVLQYDAALNCYYAYIELVKEQQRLWPTARESSSIPELSIVALRHPLEHEGRLLPEGGKGTVVHAYRDGEHYEVEFSEPFPCAVTVARDDIQPA